MSCCGTPRSELEANNRPQPSLPPLVSNQPGFQPSPAFGEKPYNQQPLQAPPAVYQPAPHLGWNATPAISPPPPSESYDHGAQSQGLNSYGIAPPSPAFQGYQQRPTSVYDRSQTTSPPQAPTPAASSFAQAVATEGRFSVAVDFGTTFSGVAYGSARLNGGKIQQVLSWPGSAENFRKIPTCLVYNDRGEVMAWGLDAKNWPVQPGTVKCEWFKLFLEPKALRDDTELDKRLPRLPPGKTAADLIADFLSCLWTYAREQITRDIGAVADLDTANVWLTVPAAWDAKGCEMMREAAISAGLVASARAGEVGWRDRLRIITEPEAAAVHCAHMTDLHKLKPSNNFMICDAGGGTVDLAVYKIIGATTSLEIAEICARSGANCGSIFLDLRFQSLLETLLERHPGHRDPASMTNFMNAFNEEKANFRGQIDDRTMFYFTCFNVLPDDPSVGLINGELAIPGNLLRTEVFEPVVDQVIHLIDEQTKKVEQKIDALLLVGGFSGSDYLHARIQDQFAKDIRVLARPFDADTATLRGAARYGLTGSGVVASVVAPRSYLMKVKLPAEKQDMMLRPAYITTNDSGAQICANRVEYLVMKGAILRRGQRCVTKLCKFSTSVHDRVFVATLFVSDADKQMRYTDEGELSELCQWHVDIGNLPSFTQNAAASGPGGFYTEFDIALEVDSAEVRGLLLYNGQAWGAVVFDFRA